MFEWLSRWLKKEQTPLVKATVQTNVEEETDDLIAALLTSPIEGTFTAGVALEPGWAQDALVAAGVIDPPAPEQGRSGKVAFNSYFVNTMYEGETLYMPLWNYWVRTASYQFDVDERFGDRRGRFFVNADDDSADTNALVSAINPPQLVTTDADRRDLLYGVFDWLSDHTTLLMSDTAKLGGESYDEIYADAKQRGGWPELSEYANCFVRHGKIGWAACFSKAHVMANILVRCGMPRWRIGIAYAHHTEGGAPPTASHVYVAVYNFDAWWVVDPTFAQPSHPKIVPAFAEFARRGLPVPDGVDIMRFALVDYQKPFQISVPGGSVLTHVPFLGRKPPQRARS